MQTSCFKAIVRGRVQGVFFRESSRRAAIELGITGYAHNLPDGTVEVVACGEAAALDAFVRWLQHGSEFARVDDVSTIPFSGQSFSDFITG